MERDNQEVSLRGQQRIKHRPQKGEKEAKKEGGSEGDGRKEGQPKIYLSEGTEDKRLTTGRRENRKEREREGEKDRDKEKGKVKRGCPTRRQQTL